MGILFISHSSRNNDQAVEVRDWLRDHGWRETFLDLDPEHGLAPGQRWQEELKKAGERCSAVVLLISPEWLASKWCQVEFLLASQLGKCIFGVLIAPMRLSELPIELTAHYQLVDISDPRTRAEGFERLRFGLKRAGLDPRDFPWPPPGQPNRLGYRGLKSLDEDDAAVFFGRDAPITRGLDALRRMRDGAPERILVILGASGAGKSSFLKAGLLARLRRDEERFLVLPTVRPERAPLSGPLGLQRSLGLAANATDVDIRARLMEVRTPILERLRRHAEAARETYTQKTPTLVLPIDQAEEFFTENNNESSAAFELLGAILAADENVVAVATIRSDSFSQLQAESRVSDVPRLPFDLPRLSPASYKEVIVGPGRLAKPQIRFESALVDRLTQELSSTDSLPLLAFTLERLVAQSGSDGQLTVQKFLVDLGGLEGAIERAVQQAFTDGLDDPDLPHNRSNFDSQARRVFLPWLVTVSEINAAPKRRIALMRELPSDTHALVRHLINQRVLVSDVRDGGTTVEVAHEAVLRHWGALASWIDQERDDLRSLAAVLSAAKEWRERDSAGESSHGETWLVHRGERLIAAESLMTRPAYPELLGAVGSEYLTACRSRENAELRDTQERVLREKKHLQRQRRLRFGAATALVLLAFAIASFAAFAVTRSRSSSREVSIVLTDYARRALNENNADRAIRLAVVAARSGLVRAAAPSAAPILAAAAHRSRTILEIRGPRGEMQGVRVSPDERMVLTWGESGIVAVFDLETGAQIAATKHDKGVNGAIFDKAGRRILSWGDDGVARVWSAHTGSEIAKLVHEGSRVNGAMFDATGSRVLSWGRQGTEGIAVIWEAATGTVVASTKHEHPATGAEFDPTGLRVLSWDGDWDTDGTAKVWMAATGTHVASSKHRGSIQGARFDPTGQYVLSWDGNSSSGIGVARVWNSSTGREIASVKHDGGVSQAIFDDAGERVLSWGYFDGVVEVWNARTGRMLALKRHPHEVRGAIFMPAGQQVLSWGGESRASPGTGSARIWIIDSKATETAISPFESEVLGSVLDQTGDRVLSWSHDGIARVWDARSGSEISALKHDGPVEGALFDSRGERVLSWGDYADRTARVWEAGTGSEVATSYHEFGVMAAAFIAGGTRVLSSDGTSFHGDVSSEIRSAVRLWSAAPVAASVVGPSVSGVVFDPPRDRLVSWGPDERGGGFSQVRNAATGEEIAATRQPDIRGSLFDPTGTKVLSWAGTGLAWIWDAVTGVELMRLQHSAAVSGASFNRSGTHVLSWDANGNMSIWGSQAAVRTIGPAQQVLRAVVDRDGERILTWNSNGLAQVWKAQTGVVLSSSKHEIGIDGQEGGAVFDPSETRVLSWWSRDVRVWDASTGAEISSYRHPNLVISARFDRSGARVLSWSAGGRVQVWNAATGQHLGSSSRLTEFAEAYFDPSGNSVLSWGTDGTARIWDATTGAERAMWQTSSIDVAFDPVGQRALTWTEKTVQVRDTATGVDLASLEVEGAILGATFNAAGDRVVLATKEGTFLLWDVSWSVPRTSNSSLIAEVCDRKLGGAENLLSKPFVDDRGRTIRGDSIRRITTADADFAPILRDRVGQDVCAAPSAWVSAADPLGAGHEWTFPGLIGALASSICVTSLIGFRRRAHGTSGTDWRRRSSPVSR